MTRPSGEGNSVSNVINTSNEHDESFETKTETSMGDGTELSKISVPPVDFLVELHFFKSSIEDIQSFFSLRSTDQFTDLEKNYKNYKRFSYTGDEDIHGGDSLVIVVQSHVESLEGLGMVVDNDGLLEDFFNQISFVFTAHIDTPFQFVDEVDFTFLIMLEESG